MVKQIAAMHKSRRVKITDINPHLTCVLCSGYLIDATTIIECLHSFCRTCIVKYLENNKYCPICDVQVHKTKPLLNIRSDQTLQDIVYKLVPGLFQNEMSRRRDFYAKHPEHKPSSAEESGEVTQFSHIYTADESISLSLEYYNNNITLDNIDNNVDPKILTNPSRRFLRCPAAVSVSHLQKLIRAKYGLSNEHRVDILYLNDKLSDDFTLMDIAYIYLWRRKGPLHLTYRIFEVSKRIKLNDADSNEKTDTKSDLSTNGNEWKEVQLQISENGIMSVTNIAAEIKLAEQPLVTDVTEIPELTPILVKPDKFVGPSKEPEGIPDEKLKESDVKLGKHKLEDVSELEPNAKVAKTNLAEAAVIKTVKNVQQLSRNHPLKIHSQAIIKSHTPPPVASTVVAKSQPKINKIVTNNNNNNAVKIAVQKDQPITPTSVQNSLPIPKLVTPKTAVQRLVPCPEKQAKIPQTCTSPSPSSTAITAPVSTTTTAPVSLAITTPLSMASAMPVSTTTSQSVTVVSVTTALISTTSTSVSATATLVSTAPVIAPPLTSVISVPLSTVVTTIIHTSSESNIPKYTQAGHSTETTTTTSKTGENIQNIEKQPVSSPVVVSCIQSSKVSIVPKKSPIKIGTPIGYKTLRDPPKAWNPQISRQNIGKTNIFNTNNGASTSDLSKADPKAKPAKFFKMRNNMPRYLGNPASGVKPMYQVREGDKSPPDPRKILELKKLEGKMNNNNKDDKDIEVKNKSEVKTKQSIIKIDPKTLRPILDKVESPSCTEVSEMKINQSSVPIFNPLRNQKSQASPKLDRRSPKCSSYDIAPKSPLDRNSKTSKPLNSPTTKKDKVNINFTPPNPFIPNLTSPNMAPNQFLYPNYPAYDPRVMNNISAFHNLPFSMFYSQPRMNYPGLSSQSLSLSPTLVSSLNLEVNKNLRKTYDIPAMLQLSPTLEKKKPATNAKREENLKVPDKVEQKPVTKSIVKKVQKPEKIEDTQIKDVKPVELKENSVEKVKEIENIGNDVKEEKSLDGPEVKDKIEEILNKKEEKIEKVSELVVDPVKT